MKTNKNRLISILLVTLLMAAMMTVPASAISPAKVELGATSPFAVLAGSSISNTGTTTIGGDAGGNVGLYPGSSFGATGVTMTGAAYLSDGSGVASLAQTDLTTAYNDAAGRTPTTAISADLGGTTLTSGVYNSATSIAITGTLTLDAQGDPEAVFIFQAGSTLITAANSEVKLINSARYCRIFWQVGSSATLGTNSKFVGHIFALTSITANTGAAVQGQLLARNGAVTLDSNTITNGICDAPATLYVIKQVVNNNSGTAVAADFTLHIKTAGVLGSDVLGSPALGSTLGTAYTLVAGNYVVSENPVAGYTASYSGSDSSGNITLAPGDIKTVTITNDDVAATPAPTDDTVYPPLINVIKTPSPLAFASGEGSVTYTYKVTNPGMVTLYNVSVTDNKVSPVNYISGDVNADNRLQTSETWIYTAVTTISATTTNMATAKGSANGMTATDIAYATVAVSSTVYPPLINVIKTPSPLVLTAGAGTVIYTYKITNPGMVALSNVSITDNKVSPVNYISGDLNSDNLLQSDETWTYTCTTTLSATTTNSATAKGSANGMTAADMAFATVVVSLPVPVIPEPVTPVPVTTTVTGGQLPVTSTPWYNVLLAGAVFVMVGAAGWKIKKKYE